MILRVDLAAILTPRDVYARLDLPACLDVTLGHHAFASLPFVPVAQDSDPAATPIILIPGEDPLTPASLFALSCATPDAVIYYTTDGSTPTQASPVYAAPFTLTPGTYTLSAFALAPGYLPSALASSAPFQVEVPGPATPVITRDSAGVYSIACETAGASIYYTLDGSTPDATKTLYATPISIIYPQTLKAIVIKDAVSSEVATSVITESVWTIAPAADGTKYVRIRCATTGQTLTAAGGAEIKLTSGGTWGTSVDIPSGATNRDVYFRGNGVGGKLLIPSPQNVTYLTGTGTGTSIAGSINGMALTGLYLSGTGTSITGSITGMALTYLVLSNTGTSITGSINGMALTYLYLDSTGTSITGSINGMALTNLVLSNTGTSITGTPAQIGTPLNFIRIIYGTSYDYPWTSQTFGGTKRTWTATSMSIDCVAVAPTPAEFNTWLLGLASVSNAGTATLTFKNTPTLEALTAAGLVSDGSGYYAMTTTLGYTLVLGE